MARLNIITKVTGDPNNPLPTTTLSSDEVNSLSPSVNALYDGLDTANTNITALQTQITSAVSGFKGSLAIANTPSAGVAGYYFPSENGTYTNAGGLVVNLTDGLNVITQTAANVFTKIVVPVVITGLAKEVIGNNSVVRGPSGLVTEDQLSAAFQSAILTLGSSVTLTPPAYASGALSRTGAVLGSAPYSTTYRRMSNSSGANMLAYDSAKKYYYSGIIDDIAVAGVTFYNSSLAFLGYDCSAIQTFTDYLLTPPAGTAFIAMSAKGTTDPSFTLKSKTVTYQTPANTTAIAQLKTDLYSDQYIGPIVVTSGAYTAGALSATGAALATAEFTGAYRRTGLGTTSTFIVQAGKIHYYTGVIGVQSVAVAGVAYLTSAGAFISAEAIVLPAGTQTTFTKFRLTVPSNAVYIAGCTMSTTLNPIIEVGQNLPNGIGNGSTTLIVNTSSVSSTEDGSLANPYKTLAAGITAISSYGGGEIIIDGPDIRESIDTSKLNRGTFKITRRQGSTTRILGSSKITGWTKTSGQTNVYQTAFAGTILTGSRWGALIFEDGRPSRPIADADRHPSQKGLTNRLPFTEIKPTTSIALVDATPGTYYVTGGIMYINTNNSSDPSTNGFSYEYPVRPANIVSSASAITAKSSIELNDLTIMYVTDGFAAVGMETLIRRNCVLMASIGQGCWRDDTAKVYSYNDEAAFCDSDGFNGHFNSYAGQAAFPQRADNGNCFYWNYWTHDNFDDGFSHHERHQVQAVGGYSEYNGDSGHVSSNDANYIMTACMAKNNGTRINVTPTENVAGEGFGCRTTVGSTRTKGCVVTIDCVSENNISGFSGNDGGTTPTTGLIAVNCISRNNTLGEYACYKIKNCTAFNSNSALIKVGTVIVENATLVF